MIEKCLKMSEGVTPDAFNASEAPPPPVEEDPNKEAKEEQKKEEVAVIANNEIKNIVYRPEVTREPRMKYFKVPRLGCYLAVPLIYSSCLFVDSLETALVDYAAYREKLKKNEEIMKEYEDSLAQAKAEEEANKAKEVAETRKSDKELPKAGEHGEPVNEEAKQEPPKLEEVKQPEYRSKPQSYVICMDTLGQDREFTQEQKAFVIETVRKYKLKWEEHEKERLTSDRKLKEEEKEKDTEYIDKILPATQDEEDKAVDERVTVVPEEVGEDERKVREKLYRWEHKIKQLLTPIIKDKVLGLSKYNVINMTRIMQTLFYLLGYQREDLCEPGTNKLFWKKARKLWNDELLDKFQNYTPIGPKEGVYKKYQTINFLEKNLEGVNEDEIKAYSLGLFKLFQCLELTLEVRKSDILRRKARREKLAKEREEAIQRSEQRTKERADELKNSRDNAYNVFYIFC